MHVEDLGSLDPGCGLRFEMAALGRLDDAVARSSIRSRRSSRVAGKRSAATFDSSPAPDAGERLLVWESARPAVVLPRHGDPGRWAHVRACAAWGVPLLRRESGGGAVVVGPGCLAVALVLSLDRRPRLADVGHSYAWLLGRVAAALDVDGVAVRSTDLAVGGRKFAGHAQRRGRVALLHHGVLLYDFDLDLIDALLPEPPRRPAWRGNRTHRGFLANLGLARDDIVRRLGRLPAALA